MLPGVEPGGQLTCIICIAVGVATGVAVGSAMMGWTSDIAVA